MKEDEMLLYKYGRLIRTISNTENEIRDLFDRKNSLMDILLRPTQLNGAKVRGGKQRDPVYDVVEKSVDVYDENIKRETEKLRDYLFELGEIKDLIQRAGLNENERQFIDLRYVEEKTFPEIAIEIKYSQRQTERFGKSALQKIKQAV